MTTVRGISLALIVAGVALGGLVGQAGADAENLTISDVTIEPNPPAPGEPFTVRVTIENQAGGSGSVEISTIYIRQASGLPEYERIRNVGSIGDDQFLTVPMRLSLKDSTNLRIHVHAEAADGENIKLEYPLYVTVEEPDDVQLAFTSTDAVVGVENPVNVTVANGDSSPVSNLELTLEGESASIRDARRASASIAAGSEREYEYTLQFTEPGTHTLTASLSYTTSEGYKRTVQESVTVSVEAPVVDPGITARITKNGSGSGITASLTNYGNAPFSDIVVRAEVDDQPYARTVVPDIDPRSTRTVTLDTSDIPPGMVSVVATFEAAGRPVQTNTSVAYMSDVSLEAVVVSDDRVNPPVTVDVGNLGQAPLADVTIQVFDGDRLVAHRIVGEVASQTTRSVTMNVSDIAATTLDVRATYRVGPVTDEIATTVQYRTNPGRIELTGVETELVGDTLRISGSTSNVGLSSVDSVVIRVIQTEDVQPAPPNREYFVGTVPPSDFVSFDLTARVDAYVTSIPVEVAYLVDGTQQTERLLIPVDQPPSPDNSGQRPGIGGTLIPALIGTVIILGVGALIYVGWRNRGGN